MKMITKCSYW